MTDSPENNPDDHVDDISARNLMRDAISDVARLLELDVLTPADAAERLRDIASMDAAALDADDIELDIDPGPVLAQASRSGPTPPPDPVEEALAHVIRLRDKITALRISGETAGGGDRADYTAALETLTAALNARFT